MVTRFREADRRIDVLVRVDEADRAGVTELRRLVVNPGRQQVPIRLSAVADIEVHEGPSEIRRIDQQRAVLNFSQCERYRPGNNDRYDSAGIGNNGSAPGMCRWSLADKTRKWRHR